MQYYLALLLLGLLSCNTKPCIDPDQVDRSINCGTIYDPVCGCDNVTYFNPCDAERNGLATWTGGPCP